MAAKKVSSSKQATNDAIALLKKDHETLRELLSELESTTPRGAKKRADLLVKIGQEVRIHARIEEEIFYPAFQRAAETGADEKLFYEAVEEHAVVDMVLPTLEETEPSSEVFGARAKVLKDIIEHHAEEEEKEMFPRAKKLMDQQELTELGAELAELRQELQGEMAGARSTRRSRGSEARLAKVRQTAETEDE